MGGGTKDPEKMTGTKQSFQEKVLLVICPMWDVALPSLGIGYIAAFLQQKGISTEVLDINIETYAAADSRKRALWSMEQYHHWAYEELFEETKKWFEEEIQAYVARILKKGCRVVGFSLTGANVLFSAEVARRLKRIDKDLFIAFGGPSCFFLHPPSTLPNAYPHPLRHLVSLTARNKSLIEPGIVDVFVRGEGEETLFNLVTAFFSHSVQPMPGTVLYSRGGYLTGEEPRPIADLDTLPFPGWEKFPVSLYTNTQFLPLLLSRGCVNRCTFCNDWKMGYGEYRSRSAENIVAEMERNIRMFGVRSFQCNDLLFNGNAAMLGALAQRIRKARLGICWSAQGSIRNNVSASLLKKLNKAGLSGVVYGVESLSEEVLRGMNKGCSFRDIRSVLRNTARAKIDVFINLITGFPTETQEQFLRTKERLKAIHRHINEISSINPCNVNAGTALESEPERFGITFLQADRCNHWESLGGTNTYAVRKQRLKELVETARRLEIKTIFQGVFDEPQEPSPKPSYPRRRKHGLSRKAAFIFLSLVTGMYLLYFYLLGFVRRSRLLEGKPE